MPDIASGLSVGTSLLGGMMQGDAAGDSAAVGAGISREQIAESRRQFDAAQKLLSPYVNTGVDALSQQRVLLGLGSLGGSSSSSPFLTREQLRAKLASQYTTTGRPNGPAIFGMSDRNAGGAIYDPNNNYEKGIGWANGIQIPTGFSQGASSIDEAGLAAAIEQAYAAQGAQGSGLTADQEQAAAMSKFENSPYFQAITRQSEDAMLQNASATGGLRGGNIQDALSKNRPILLQSLIDKQLANLSGLSTSGQNAAAGVGTAAMNTGTAVNSALGAGGAAQAGGILGQSNANISALGNIGGMFANKFAGSGSLFAPAVTDGGYSMGLGSAYGGSRAGL